MRQIRQHRKISQGKIAKAIGVSVGTVQNYERGRASITTDRLEQLARALQCEPAELLQPPGSPLPRYRYRSRQLMAHNDTRTWMIAPPPDEEQ